ncbi:MAG TPA: tetratricopeptide repeat protein [Bacteriovoracaceae bacterium]|nr:tetratricopeptide repeat protein [Bacteriovoracaceae bacterium]
MINHYRYHSGEFEVNFLVLAIQGPDSFSFLQAQATYDLGKIETRGFHLVSFLDPQGRLETYGWLLKTETAFKLLVPPAIAVAAMERLHRFLISEEVTIEEIGPQVWTVRLGPELSSQDTTSGFNGRIFDEVAYLCEPGPSGTLPRINHTDLEKWRLLTGWPSFDGTDFKKDLITNLGLFDLSVSNKGCYPGQETVSKIATRRGAAYSPVLIELATAAEPGVIYNFDRKIGEAFHCICWEEKFYLIVSLLRDFRVEKMALHFRINGTDYSGRVRYYPLLSGKNDAKALELFYQATENFKHDDFIGAEEKFRHAIKLDPAFADAYESLGVMLGRLERFPEAIDLMQMLSKLDAHSVLAHTNMSMFLMKLGKIEEAEEQKSLATVKNFQKFGEEARLKDAGEKSKMQKASEWSQRESMFRQVLEIDRDDSLANFGLGSIAVERGEWEQARIHLETVLRAEPSYSVAYLALGKAYLGLGRKAEAHRIWKEGIKVAASKGDLMPANQMQSELENG